MLEKIYTIPVNEAFDACAADHTAGCPFCRLYEKLENDELDIILGAAMMEPDIRIRTNESGFCHHHYDMMAVRKNRLGLALMMESHLDDVRKTMDDSFAAKMIKGVGHAASHRLDILETSCYLCSRIEDSLSKMIENSVYLWDTESDFRQKLTAQPWFCLPHYNRFVEQGREKLQKKRFADFYEAVSTLEKAYFDELRGDVKHFIRKFDYRFEDEPWGNAKDAIERAIRFLSGVQK